MGGPPLAIPAGMMKLRAALALLRGARSGRRPEAPAPPGIPSGASVVDRRSGLRLTVAEVPFVSQIRLKFGPAVALIDLSSGGAQIETTNVGLQPGSMVIIEMTGQQGRRAIPAQVLRCQLASLQPELVYRVALIFTPPVDLKDFGTDLGADSVEPMADDLDPALESQRLRGLLAGLVVDPSRRPASADALAPAVLNALEAARSTLDTPAGQRAGPALATALAGLFKATTDALSTAPTATALVAAIAEQLKHVVPARAIRDAESFLQLPGSEAILFTLPALDPATPVRRLAIEFADGCEPLELHVQMLKAGVQLLAIAHELGRLHGYDRPLVGRPDASSVPAGVVLTDDRPHMHTPIASSEYWIEKYPAEATLLLSSGQVARGHFFVGDSLWGEGHELVGELLNSATGFVPFEEMDAGVARIVLYNLAHLVLVTLTENDARRVSGYEVARHHVVSLRLSNTQRLVGAVRAYLPGGLDRVSDWARAGVNFRYVETDDATVIINVQHVTDVTEIEQP
jgi:hypothetical protein